MKSEPPTFQDQATHRVSFVLTTWNKAKFLERALERTRQLIKPEDELIVVDGGSTDGTHGIIAKYDNLVDIFISEPDISPYHALNKGILIARGKYIKHLTDDDEFFPEATEQAIEVLEAHPDIDILLCGGMRQLGDAVYPWYVPPGANYGKSPEDIFKYGICGVGLFMRRSSLPQIGLGPYNNVAAEAEFVAQAITNGAIVKFCRINSFHHPIYDHSFIVARRRAWERDMDRMVRRYCSRWFYLKYLVKTSILRNRILGTPAIAGRNFVLAILARLGSRRAQIKLHPQEPIWDGGFS